ncbi:MAG: efflux RND transporter periplasmic adaptor subunit, partial [Candidatus Acidiferrum sp.]
MTYQVHIGNRVAAVFMIAAIIVVGAGLLESSRSHGQTTNADSRSESSTGIKGVASETTLELSPSQLNAVKIAPVGSYLFPVDEQAVGNIDFDGDLSVQVFPLYQGTILKTLVELGAEVRKDQPLYTIKSPDLIQAESTLIGAAATFELTSKELDRAKSLNGTNGVSERELEQATSDEQTAEGALKAARDAVRVFGKTDAEIDQMISSRKIDPALVVRSPISGKVTSR